MINIYKNHSHIYFYYYSVAISLFLTHIYCKKVEKVESLFYIHQDEMNLTEDEHIDNIIYNFMKHGALSYLKNNVKIKLLSKKIPLFDLFLIEQNVIEKDPNAQYSVQTTPVLKHMSMHELVKLIKFLLLLNEKVSGKILKCIISIMIYDLLFRNFKFCKDHSKFAHTMKNKIKEFESESEVFNNVSDKYDLESNLVQKWHNKLNEYFAD